MTIWRMRIACWIPKATDAQSESRTLIGISTTTVVARMRVGVTLYVHCLSCMQFVATGVRNTQLLYT